ncbi:DUF3592 domain-containing protein [uncultured Intestinimonas sp.]|uniref:DUF3592 domain-containing protein n=1 Tax=uncultured Intestinimonas sp. TaxID=1689265 RepID=UPI002941D3BC|nr:DUF3592 domain-containing protein [uncultured Intestinimonas sp.]
MNYHQQTDRRTLRMFMEVLEEETQKNPVWTLQGLFALCRDVSLLDNVPENADYFDEIYLTIAELFSEFNRYGRLIDVPDVLKQVCSFTTDEAAKAELLSALDALHSGTIQGRTRSLTAQWETEGTWQAWQRHIEELRSELAEVLPVQARTAPDEIEAAIEGHPAKKKKGGKVMTAVFLAFSLLFAGLALYLFLQGAGAICRAVSLRIQGIKTTAEVTQVAAVTPPRRTNSFREDLRYTYYEVVRFQTEDGLEVEGRLPEKTSSDNQYSVGDEVEIYYHPDAPAQVLDAHMNRPLVTKILSVVAGLLFFFVFSTLSRWLFSTMGSLGPALSVASKVILLLLAVGLFTYQNLHALYRYLPATQEDACTNQNGIIVSEKDGKPFTGRMKSNTERSLSIYSYKDGLLDGVDVVYYDGAVKETGHWKEGKQNGLFTLYTTGGILVDYAHFEEGERHGLTRQYDPETGSVTHVGNYLHGEMDGRWVAYDPDTGYILTEQTYREGVLHGPAKQYYSNGQLQIDMNFEDGVAQGPYKAYYPSGQLQVEDNLEHGSYSSQVKMYHEDGTPMEISSAPFGDGAVDSDESGITITETDEEFEDGVSVSEAFVDALTVSEALWRAHSVSSFDEQSDNLYTSIPMSEFLLGSDGEGNISCEVLLAEDKILRIEVCHAESGQSRYLVQGFEQEEPFIVEQQIPQMLESLIAFDPNIDPFDMLICIINETAGSPEGDLSAYAEDDWRLLGQ